MKIKHYFLTALFPIMFWTGSFAQWITQTSGTTQSISSIYATGTANVFAVGNNGIARKTINSGNTWQTMNSSSTNAQNSIRFINSTTGFTAGAWQDILQTTDSGNSWSNIGGGMTDLYDCYFISSTSGWVGGDIEAGYGFLYNPSTFNLIQIPANANKVLRGIYFTNSTTGWVIGDGGLIIKTINFGTSWSQQTSGVTNQLNKVMFIDANNGVAVGNSGTILKTTNAGSSWTSQASGTTQNLKAVYFADAQNIWVCGDTGTIIHSSDTGQTWASEISGTTENLNAIHGSGITNIWACGNNGKILYRPGCLTAPNQPGTISGNTTVCSGSSNTYSIMAGTGTTSYTWTLPGGWTGISTTTSITVVADSSGNISVTANNTCGSSTAQTISVTVNIVNTSVSQSGVTLTANATGATYQWINCNGNTPISGQPNQSFTATNGSYAVIVTQNSCSDTSVCYNITTEGIYFVKNYDGENIHTEKIMIH